MEHHNISTKPVSRETFDRTDQIISKYNEQIELYLERLLWWNKRVNLVSRNVSRGTILNHIQHSLLLSQLDVFKEAKLIVDAGTGGGLPGIPLAITHSDKHMVLNDLVTKKCMAMKQMAQKISLTNIGIIDGSIENIQQEEPFLLISKHAFKINNLFQMTAHLPWRKMVLYKGTSFEEELQEISPSLDIQCYDLSSYSEFYTGKALVVVNR
ncbi:16S rRNA (guanine(527)-N(7))-methyltransferase RsmG [Fodinibius saliphilus]|uniref:16S rRNA (guanine(527)-N(7))-methyltransferase RsmG n=1 Tax=Fodinibius saliphilus TaxID=1920650 RepID=UPI0014867F9C|nr:RsmG family class I SAM-dependent methyltransferase [Fodinibius saliphilus]